VLVSDIRAQAAEDGLDGDTVQTLIDDVGAVDDIAEIDRRLLGLAAYGRLSARHRAEKRILDERKAGLVVLGRVLGGDTRVADGPHFAQPNPAPGVPPSGHGGWNSAGGDRHVQQHRTNAMNTLSRHQATGVLNAAAADRADKVLREGDPRGQTARYISAVGDPGYASAFAKMLHDPQMGHLKFGPAEVEAVREANYAVQNAAVTTGTTGVPLPLTIDPSIVITGAGALSPLRDLADVRSIGTHDHLGVSSDGVTAAYVQEGTEATDATPVLAGPRISTQQGRAFVQWTIETGQDWDGISNELVQLIADAKNVLDATKFLSGTGTNEPYGVFGGNATYSLTTAQRIQTVGVAALAAGDSWLLKAGIPARFIADTTFLANPVTWDAIFQLVPAGSTTLAQQFGDSDRGGGWLGRPKAEWSTMASGTTTGTKLVVGGNWKTGYRIVDRLGLQAEILPHMLGATRLPLGVRGMYCYWRTGAAVTGQNALRYLEVK
jgi:HK97 family phage major capsid protein